MSKIISKPKIMKKILTYLLASAIIFSACTTSDPVAKSAENLNIVTTIAPLYSLTANLIEGVDNVTLTNLVAPNTSVHTFALTPKAAKDLSDADLIVINGLELEAFLEGSLADSKALVVDSSKNVSLLKFPELIIEGAGDEGEEEEEEHHGEYDPHIWLSPENAKVQATNIAAGLKAVDPDHSALYSQNLDTLLSKLDALNNESKKSLAQLDIKAYLVFHDAYQYFEKNFEVQAVGFLEESAGNEPSATYMARLIDIIQSEQVVAIFAEPQFSPKLVQTLSEDYNLTKGELDPLGQEVSKDAYFKLIRGNVESFKSMFAIN